ncbi:GDSL-type esterase/lipase family protein [Lysinibacillus sp. NPDC056185]|uniref:GDSL-type esterase/lipase family protein n=1 Tax=Lysinibacillus sp. NPDC056185 TaxID=3345739 RepID=UPI0039EFA245
MGGIWVYPYIEVINRATRACTIKHVNQGFIDYLCFYEPDIIVLQIGIVDCWIRENGKQFVSKGEFFNSMNGIVDLLKKRPNGQMIIVGICPTSEKMESRYPEINQEINFYNNIYKQFLNEKQIHFIDMEQFIKSTAISTYLLPDDQHINPNGNKLVATEVIKIVNSYIYNELGTKCFNDEDFKTAFNFFEKAYEKYNGNLDNLYNYILLLIENNNIVKLRNVLDSLKTNKFDKELMELIGIANKIIQSGN